MIICGVEIFKSMIRSYTALQDCNKEVIKCIKCASCLLAATQYNNNIYKYSVTTTSIVNSSIYMTTSFDPKVGSSSGHETRTWNMYRNQNHKLETLVSVYVATDDDLTVGSKLVAM